MSRGVSLAKTVQYWPGLHTPTLQVFRSFQPSESDACLLNCLGRSSGITVGWMFPAGAPFKGTVEDAIVRYELGSQDLHGPGNLVGADVFRC